ncbi:hypothetical protein ACFX1T_014065 [Malus domestica]
MNLKIVSHKHVPPAKPNPFPNPNPGRNRVPALPYKKLTPDEVQRKRERGKCWFCDDKWDKGHKCAHKQLLMLDIVSDKEFGDEEPNALPVELQSMAMSECAFYGISAKPSVQTMKVEVLINNYTVSMLLDSRSTHNFIDSRLVKQLGWSLQPTKPFEVMIADGG